jgi:hypothetical protein
MINRAYPPVHQGVGVGHPPAGRRTPPARDREKIKSSRGNLFAAESTQATASWQRAGAGSWPSSSRWPWPWPWPDHARRNTKDAVQRQNIFIPLILINDIVCRLSINGVLYKQFKPTKAIFHGKLASPIGCSSKQKTDGCSPSTSQRRLPHA